MNKYLIIIFSFLSLNTFSQSRMSSTWLSSANNITSIYADSKEIWMGAYSSISRKDLSTGVIETFSSTNSPLSNSDNNINSIIKDKSGKVWFGTNTGLLVFDNYNWTLYNTSNSLISGNSIVDLKLDTLGNIWIVSENTRSGDVSAIDLFSNSTFRNIDVSTNFPIVNPFNRYRICVGAGNKVWLAVYNYQTSNSGILFYDFINDTWHPSLVGTAIDPNNICSDSTNRIWYTRVYKDSLYCWDGITIKKYELDSALNGERILRLQMNEANNTLYYLYMINSSSHGYGKFDGQLWEHIRSTTDTIVLTYNCFGFDSSGQCYIGTWMGVLKESNLQDHSITPGFSSGSQMTKPHLSPDGKLWFASYPGIGYTDGYNYKYWNQYEDSIYMHMYLIEADDSGNVWHQCIGESYDTLYISHYIKNTKTWERFKHVISGYPSYDFEADNNGNLWYWIRNSGIYKFDGLNHTLYSPLSYGIPNSSPLKVESDINGNPSFFVYDGTSSYFLKFENNLWSHIYAPTTITNFSSGLPYTYNKTNELYVGRDSILSIYNDISGWTDQTISAPSIGPVKISAMQFDSKNVLWIYSNNFPSLPHLISYDQGTTTVYNLSDYNITYAADGDFTIDQCDNIYLTNTYSCLVLNPYHEVNPGRDCIDSKSSISGLVYNDINQNSLRDSLESTLPNQRIVNISTNKFVFSDSSGYYKMYLPNGSHEVTGVPYANWYISSTPATYSIQLRDSSFINADFGMENTNTGSKLQLDLSSITPAYCNKPVKYKISYANDGSNSITGMLKLQLDSSLNYISSTTPPDIINGNELTWQNIHLDSYQNDSKLLLINVNNVEGTILNSTLSFTETSGNIVLQKEFEQEIHCTELPVRKEVDKIGIGANHLVSNTDTLEYTFYFDNFGIDTCKNVVLLDTLSAFLNPSTVQFVSSSTPCNMNVDLAGIIKIEFDSIDLPSRLIDSLNASGYVKFKAAFVNSIQDGAIVKNNGIIRFAYNYLQLSNTVFNTISTTITSTENSPNSCFSFTIYPNPFTDDIQLSINANNKNKSFHVSIFDISGKKLIDHTNINCQLTINSQNLSQGMYFIVIEDGEGNSKTEKIIKQ